MAFDSEGKKRKRKEMKKKDITKDLRDPGPLVTGGLAPGHSKHNFS